MTKMLAWEGLGLKTGIRVVLVIYHVSCPDEEDEKRQGGKKKTAKG
jgi:hypothetical protein